MSIKVGRQTALNSRDGGLDYAVASAYNHAGDKYLAYADGDPRKLYDFDGHYAYGDRQIWETLFSKLRALRASGAKSIRILDIGCGPGTWLRRVVTRARALGFTGINARGFDIAGGQIRRAQEHSTDLARLPGVDLAFETGDILQPLPEADGGVDLCLCLCGVLNHVEAADHPAIFAEIARVTKGGFVTSVRAIGSTPTVYVDSIEQARQFHQDNRNDRLDVEFQNGRRMSLPSHLFSAGELRALIAPHLEIEDVCGLDLFHGRFVGDPRWNPDCKINGEFANELEQLEKSHCRDIEFIDHATHLLLTAKRSVTKEGAAHA